MLFHILLLVPLVVALDNVFLQFLVTFTISMCFYFIKFV